ncbi:hypothetical protein J7379_08925 [Xanthomonas phaseoli pv. dieffenbachiae]|uniref:hypothetical protein n=1 Tax=Xanthomonas TaxID=338 RepID=UPI001AD99E29|nr:hypothetical protein [Xanthomonas phaseoli]MBO9778251.1 hypothetical protein [Xanthomonas phaseoli pv. dieffenbachiae]MBO9805492.1 hypothetical protein [Xanthomonas phaseoli pv. dieffenbachiae]MBO9818797.1 hypothetical protein [Xanthomonas phaseoli pv. dieffenbachiae]MBO9823258.1 hypothetical protein [Xanthomonas phaseoli pv. dieffenbachiae]MBO9910079.1 hypothetical protein [Xanthomonas phaseoli pv. dieffenbachiae]
MKLSTLCLALLMTVTAPAVAKGPATSDAQIRKALIAQSIDGYSGSCPCPYNTARNGSSCGRRSAYSRGGGYAPLCYDKDVTKQMVAEYRATSR